MKVKNTYKEFCYKRMKRGFRKKKKGEKMTKTIEFIKASNDGIFKTLFGDEKNKDLLEKLLEETLKRKVKV